MQANKKKEVKTFKFMKYMKCCDISFTKSMIPPPSSMKEIDVRIAFLSLFYAVHDESVLYIWVIEWIRQVGRAPVGRL